MDICSIKSLFGANVTNTKVLDLKTDLRIPVHSSYCSSSQGSVINHILTANLILQLM
jgi:hypothetical protein